MTTAIIHFQANNDRNGNPRRVYVLLDDQIRQDGSYEALAAWDEGYSGYNAVPGDFRNKARIANTCDCSIKEYKEWLKLPSPAYAWDVKGYEHLRTA